jgi:hypothetical protein
VAGAAAAGAAVGTAAAVSRLSRENRVLLRGTFDGRPAGFFTWKNVPIDWTSPCFSACLGVSFIILGGIVRGGGLAKGELVSTYFTVLSGQIRPDSYISVVAIDVPVEVEMFLVKIRPRPKYFSPELIFLRSHKPLTSIYTKKCGVP